MQRYRAALAPFGFERIRQVYEPVAAAFFYARKLDHDATVLVAFEAGTGRLAAKALGHSGGGIAGDRFDARILEHVVLPRLGKGTTYRDIGKRLELPRSCFAAFASWHELSFMRHSKGFRELKELAKWADEPEKLARFIRLVEHDQGYPLYRAVSEARKRSRTRP